MSSAAGAEPARQQPVIELHEYQRRDVESPARFQWSCWARQTGKSFSKSLRRITRGLHRQRNQIFLSAGLRQSLEVMEKARAHCQSLKIAFDYRESRFSDYSNKKLEIRLPGGVRVIALPANPLTARGYTGDVFLDEFAMHTCDREIWAALFPTLLRGGGELDIASTPKGRSNVFYQLGENPMFRRSIVTLPQAIADGLPVDLEEMRAAIGDEETFRQEFLCEFLDEATAFLTYEQIAGCVNPVLTVHRTVGPLAAEARDMYVGVDVGRLRDLTVIWVFAARNKSVEPPPDPLPLSGRGAGVRVSADGAYFFGHVPLLITVALIELAQKPFCEQFELLSDLLAIRQVRVCCIDAGGLGMQLAEELVRRFGPYRVRPIFFTAAAKSDMACALRVAVENRTIVIPPDEKIRTDWHSVDRSVTESGLFRLQAPRREGSHADRFWAAALALHAAGAAPGKLEHIAGGQVRFARKGTW